MPTLCSCSPQYIKVSRAGVYCASAPRTFEVLNYWNKPPNNAEDVSNANISRHLCNLHRCLYQDRLRVQTEYKWLRHHHRHPGRCKPNSRWNRQQQRVHVHQEGDLIFPTSYKLNCLKFYRNALDLRDHGWNKRLYYSHQSIKLAPYFLSPATTGHELQKWLQTESSEDRFCLP